MGEEFAFVVMAAGVGSRYNGIKQLESFGPGGLTLAEYNMSHAMEAGCKKFYLIVNEKCAETFHRRLKNFLSSDCTFGLIYQRREEALARFCNRVKPWGTAHAIMCCGGIVDCNFCVTNADDLYGRDAIFRAIEFARSAKKSDAMFANVAYMLSETLSPGGSVSRGMITVEEDSKLRSIDEVLEISTETLETTNFSKNSPVSMNLWSFTPEVFKLLRAGWEEFKKNIADVAVDEFGLPFFINSAIKRGKCSVVVLRTTSKWHGVTYKTDAALMEKALEK
jgi:NDP-sugar pyrophosphorylase family protein